MRYDKEKVLPLYRKLPEQVLQMINGDAYEGLLIDLQSKYKLPHEAVRAISEELIYVAVGFETLDDFEKNYSKATALPADTAHGVCQDLQTRLFPKLTEELERAKEGYTVFDQPIDADPMSKKPSEEAPKVSHEHGSAHASAMSDPKKAGAQTHLPKETTVIAETKPPLEPPKPVINDPYREPIG